MSIAILDDVPFARKKRSTSRNGNDLMVIYELTSAPPTTLPRRTSRLPDPNGGPNLRARENQILVWVSLAQRNPGNRAVANDRCFPVIFDSGCDSTLVISEWHLLNWAQSASFDPRRCRVQWFVDETVASTSSQAGAIQTFPIDLRNLVGKPLGVVLLDPVFAGFRRQFLPKIEADIWLPRNQKGERDYVISQPPSHLLQVNAIICRPGKSARPPLLGLRAFTYGDLIQYDMQSGKGTRLPKKPTARIDYDACCLTLEYP